MKTKNLTALQMNSRDVIMFGIALNMIGVLGRRLRGTMPLDNMIPISLGAVASRAIVGPSEFVPVFINVL